MKTHNYLFRISCLELYYPLIINDEICIIPNSDNMRDEIESNLIYIDFNPSSFSYLLIQSEIPINREELENLAKKTISMFIILILNPLYLEEFYHFKYNKGNFSLIEASIKPFEEPNLKKKRSYLDRRLGVYSFNRIAGNLYKKISKNPISDSLYSIIMEYIASYKEPLIEISGTSAWNVLEHIASRYWDRKDKKKLYIIKEEKLNDYIEFLDINANQFIRDNIGKDDVTLDLPDYKENYKDFLKRTITRDIIRFSPVKFRIYRMFEEEKIPYKSDKELIKDMYEIRVDRYHYGLNIAEIQHNRGINPISVIVRFRPFLYRKILEFLGFIDEFFIFDSGYLINKEELLEIPKILERDLDIRTKLEESKLVQKIKSLDDLLLKLIGTDLDAEVIDKGKHHKLRAKLSKNKGEYIITFFDPPPIFFSAFDEIPSNDQKYPEDITRYLRPVKCTFIYNNIRYEIEFYNKPLNYPFFNIKISHPEIEKYIEEKTGKERKKKEDNSMVQFKIIKITMIEI